MPTTTIQTIIEITELTDSISQHLSPNDIACCLRVCREWSFQFRTFLWRYFQPHGSTTLLQNLHQNLHLIRTVDLKDADDECDVLEALVHGLVPIPIESAINSLLISTTPSRPSESVTDLGGSLCTNLRHLSVGVDSYSFLPRSCRPLSLLLHHNRHLTRLHLPTVIFNLDDEASAQCMEELSRLHSLQHLTLQNNALPQRTLFSLLRACLALPRLRELFLDFLVDWEHDIHRRMPELEAIIRDALNARSSGLLTATKITALQLPECELDINPLVFPLLESGLLDLEFCVIPQFSDNVDPDRIERTVRERCPHLRHLKCLKLWELSRGAQDQTCAFIRGCSHLESFRANAHFNNWGITDAIIRNLVSTLVQCHSSTLEEIEVLQCTQFSSKGQRVILSRCKQLKRFWIVPHEYGGCGVSFEGLVGTVWVCSGLKELGLTLTRYLNLEDESWEDATDRERRSSVTRQKLTISAELVKSLYAQIGRLDHLRVLSLGADKSWGDVTGFEWDLTLSKGGLGELAGLKDLADFEMRTDLWSGMGQAEVEFMHKKWPLLRKITFGTWSSTFKKLMMEPHWLWLQAQRPQLQFNWTNPANESQ